MNQTRAWVVLLAMFAIGAFSLQFSATASAQYDTTGYINELNAAGLIDHDGKPCNIVNGLCHGQFPDGSASLQTGMYVCRQVAQGRSRDSLVYELSHGEGLMPSSYNAPILYDAATTFLC